MHALQAQQSRASVVLAGAWKKVAKPVDTHFANAYFTQVI